MQGGWGGFQARSLVWRHRTRPTLLSREYTVRIDYDGGASPTITIEEPDLKLLADGRKLPHVYEQDPAQLCLYVPDSGEWARHMLIADTFVPWTDVWLYYYEDWLKTDDWKGGGVHPSGTQRRTLLRRA